jgi:DNA-binding SARP family transcriptional activator
MHPLRFLLFGSFQVVRIDNGTELHLPPSACSLLSYLVLRHQRRYRREVLVGAFWGGVPEHRARACLNTTLWRMRKALAPVANGDGDWIVCTASGDVTISAAASFQVDASEMEVGIRTALALAPESFDTGHAEALEQALALYTGDLLEGVYEDWAQSERERFRTLHLAGLTHLMRFRYAERNWDQALDVGERILQADPFREDVHRDLMRVHAAAGRRSAALRQFDRCKEVLRSELGVEPCEETLSLYHLMRSDKATGITLPRRVNGKVALERLQEALQTFEAARGELARSMALLESIGVGSAFSDP